jgi:hypothetical protein
VRFHAAQLLSEKARVSSDDRGGLAMPLKRDLASVGAGFWMFHTENKSLRYPVRLSDAVVVNKRDKVELADFDGPASSEANAQGRFLNVLCIKRSRMCFTKRKHDCPSVVGASVVDHE